MTQYGFFFDQSRCPGCQACTLSCKNWKQLPPGPLKLSRIYEIETGSFPNVRTHFYWMTCFHCQHPVCLDSCPDGAIKKHPEYGTVHIIEEDCSGCRICYDVCPYGAPVFEDDKGAPPAQKCDMCVDRLDSGLKPICVLACPYRALDFGPLAELVAKYGDNADLPNLPDSRITKPAVVFKQHHEKKKLVAYDAKRAIELMMHRGSLPDLFGSPADVEVPEGTVARSRLEIKHDSVDELMRRTRSDEG